MDNQKDYFTGNVEIVSTREKGTWDKLQPITDEQIDEYQRKARENQRRRDEKAFLYQRSIHDPFY